METTVEPETGDYQTLETLECGSSVSNPTTCKQHNCLLVVITVIYLIAMATQ